MRRVALVSCFVMAAASCSDDYSSQRQPTPPGTPGTSGQTEAGVSDAGVGKACDTSKPFTSTSKLALSDGVTFDSFARLTADELTIVFHRRQDYDANTQGDIYLASRGSVTAPFGAAAPITQLNLAAVDDLQPTVNADGSEIIFSSARPDVANRDLFLSKRSSPASAYSTPVPLGVDTAAYEFDPYLSGDTLWFVRANQIFYSDRGLDDGFSDAHAVPELANEDLRGPLVTADGLRIYYGALNDPTAHDVFTATRANKGVPFGTPTLVGELQSAGEDLPTWLSPDGCRLYFSSTRDGTNDLFIASRTSP